MLSRLGTTVLHLNVLNLKGLQKRGKLQFEVSIEFQLDFLIKIRKKISKAIQLAAYFAEVVVEVHVGRAQVPAQQGGVRGKDSRDVDLTRAAH